MSASSAASQTVKERFQEISEKLARVAADRWSHEFHSDGERIVVTRAVFDRNGKRLGDEAPATLCDFGVEAAWHEKEFLRDAREDLGFVLDWSVEASRIIRDLRARLDRLAPSDDFSGRGAGAQPSGGGQARAKDLAAEASMKCAETAFQSYLRARFASDDDGDLADSANAAAVLRRALGIGSRRQLNTDPEAAGRWRDLRADYQAWGRG
ncbi:hypothetical protein [Hoeflea sp.]|uniref:hypothetical protein n=1 Tax=Hoeflea sp. TaxID=1940281 RepID=UPI002AFE982E|nr:hypothetical protein [Hoeflea sp.]